VRIRHATVGSPGHRVTMGVYIFSVLTILILSLLVIVLLLHRYMKFLERVADRLSQIDERGRQLKSPSQE
jgi:phosphate uptake regulator